MLTFSETFCSFNSQQGLVGLCSHLAWNRSACHRWGSSRHKLQCARTRALSLTHFQVCLCVARAFDCLSLTLALSGCLGLLLVLSFPLPLILCVHLCWPSLSLCLSLSAVVALPDSFRVCWSRLSLFLAVFLSFSPTCLLPALRPVSVPSLLGPSVPCSSIAPC